VKLGLNGSSVATRQTGLTAPVSVFIDSHSGQIDSREPGAAKAWDNSEVGGLVDLGFVAESTDAPLKVDVSHKAKVVSKIPGGDFTNLVLAEDARLDPFKLERCATAGCSGTRQFLFDGSNWATKNAVLARPDCPAGPPTFLRVDHLFAAVAGVDGVRQNQIDLDSTLTVGEERS